MDYFLTKRKVTALAILIIGISASFVILSPEKNSISSSNPEDKNINNESLLSYESLVSETQAGNNLVNEENVESGNVTENLINSLSNDIVDSEGSNISRDEVDSLINSNFSNYFEEEEFSSSDIQISSDNSEQSQIDYFEKVDRDIHDVFEGFQGESSTSTLRKFLEDDNPEPLNYLISNIPNFIDKLLETEVPPSLAESHVEFLNIWHKKLTIYSAIRSYEDDPLKAFASMQELQSVVEDDFRIQTEMINTYNKLINEN